MWNLKFIDNVVVLDQNINRPSDWSMVSRVLNIQCTTHVCVVTCILLSAYISDAHGHCMQLLLQPIRHLYFDLSLIATNIFHIWSQQLIGHVLGLPHPCSSEILFTVRYKAHAVHYENTCTQMIKCMHMHGSHCYGWIAWIMVCNMIQGAVYSLYIATHA